MLISEEAKTNKEVLWQTLIREPMLHYIGRLGKSNSCDDAWRTTLRLVRRNCKYEGAGVRNKISAMIRNDKGIKCRLNLRCKGAADKSPQSRFSQGGWCLSQDTSRIWLALLTEPWFLHSCYWEVQAQSRSKLDMVVTLEMGGGACPLPSGGGRPEITG